LHHMTWRATSGRPWAMALSLGGCAGSLQVLTVVGCVALPGAAAAAAVDQCGASLLELDVGRGLHSFTFWLNVSACCGIGGPSRDYI